MGGEKEKREGQKGQAPVYRPRCVLPRELNPSWGSLREGIAREVEEPAFGIDWEHMQRFCEWKSTRKEDRVYRGEEAHREITAYKEQNLHNREEKGVPGYEAKDVAVNECFSNTIPPLAFMGPGRARTPQERGTKPHEGTPEENSAMVARALRLMGAAAVGFVELYDETTRKLIYLEEVKGGPQTVFEDVEVGYETPEKRVIPRKAAWVIVYSIPMSGLGLGQAPSQLSRGTTMQAYVRLYTIYNQLHEFIRALGYHSYGAAIMNGFGIYPAFAVLGGIGEQCRIDTVISPEYGSMMRLAAMATDLPLAATLPISMGVREYCAKCRICSRYCLSGAISGADGPGWEPEGPWSNPGHEAYFRRTMRCRDMFYRTGSNCGVCISRCPFSEPDPVKYREFLRKRPDMTAGRIPLAEALPPVRDPQKWWSRKDGPELDIVTRYDGKWSG